MANYEDRIREARSDLSPSFLILADFLLDSYTEAAFMTATRLAHRLDVDPATVVRFAQRLGYPGYPELQREIRDRVNQELLSVTIPDPGSPAEAVDTALAELARYLELTRRSFPLDTAMDLVTSLDEAERVILISEGFGRAPAQTLASFLEAGGYTVYLAGDSVALLARALIGARKKDLAIALEVDAESPIVSRGLAEAKRAGLQTAAVVAAASSEAATHADLVIAGHGSPESGVGQVIVESLIHALTQLLVWARPGRFVRIQDEAADITRRIIGGKG